jgi:hypothetical protein
MVMALSGCVAPMTGVSRQAMIARIADDTAAFNDAYAHAVNGQILLNILRSRDRQPRYYLSTTGISDAPLLDDQASINIGGIGLGRSFDPWGLGSLNGRRELSRRPSYAVQPLSADTLIKSVFLPTPTNVFQHYWESGWPRDMLVLLMVDRITRVEGGKRESFDNEANNVSANCVEAVNTSGCAFVRAARAMLSDIASKTPVELSSAQHCGLVGAYGPGAVITTRKPSKDEPCPASVIVGGATYYFELRSFDDIVYYVGELMRAGYTTANGDPDAVLEAPINVSVAGLRGGGAGAPLFRLLPESAANAASGGKADTAFAASVVYGGHRYFAGQAVGRACPQSTADGLCADNIKNGDRSSSVLSLLAELLALNQSPDAIRAPSRGFVE